MICDKKAYHIKLSFSNDNYPENEQVVKLASSITGFTLAEAVKNITVKDKGTQKWYINAEGKLKKRT